MRVTLTSTIREAQAQLLRTEQQLSSRTLELSSGRRLNRLSDDPSASASAIVQRGEVSRLDSYVRAADSVESRLSIVDSLLSDIIVQITAAQTSAAAGRSTITSPAQREALATEIEGIRDTILADVNTQVRGSYLFSGAATTTEPYTKSGGTISVYQGDATDVHVDIGRSTAIKTSMNGDELLRGADANDLFVELDALAAAVRAGDMVGIDAGLQALDRAFARATTVQSRLGNNLRLIGEQRLHLSDHRVAAVEQLSRHEDADLVESISALKQAEVAYQATVRAISVRFPLSLLDFVR